MEKIFCTLLVESWWSTVGANNLLAAGFRFIPEEQQRPCGINYTAEMAFKRIPVKGDFIIKKSSTMKTGLEFEVDRVEHDEESDDIFIWCSFFYPGDNEIDEQYDTRVLK